MYNCSKCKQPTDKEGYCPPCKKAYNKAYQKNKRKELNEKRKTYYYYNKEKILAISKRWRDANRD